MPLARGGHNYGTFHSKEGGSGPQVKNLVVGVGVRSKGVHTTHLSRNEKRKETLGRGRKTHSQKNELHASGGGRGGACEGKVQKVGGGNLTPGMEKGAKCQTKEGVGGKKGWVQCVFGIRQRVVFPFLFKETSQSCAFARRGQEGPCPTGEE